MTKGKNLRHNHYFHCERSCHHETRARIRPDYLLNKIGDYYFPGIALPPDGGDIGIWGRRRKKFLRKQRPILFNELLLTGELSIYLVQVNQEALERLGSLIESIKAAQGISEELKACDPMAWVDAINNIRACAEEIIYAELVYV